MQEDEKELRKASLSAPYELMVIRSRYAAAIMTPGALERGDGDSGYRAESQRRAAALFANGGFLPFMRAVRAVAEWGLEWTATKPGGLPRGLLWTVPLGYKCPREEGGPPLSARGLRGFHSALVSGVDQGARQPHKLRPKTYAVTHSWRFPCIQAVGDVHGHQGRKEGGGVVYHSKLNELHELHDLLQARVVCPGARQA